MSWYQGNQKKILSESEVKEDDDQEPSEISPSALQIKENIARMRELEEEDYYNKKQKVKIVKDLLKFSGKFRFTFAKTSSSIGASCGI